MDYFPVSLENGGIMDSILFPAPGQQDQGGFKFPLQPQQNENTMIFPGDKKSDNNNTNDVKINLKGP